MLKQSQRVRRTEEFDGIFQSGEAVHGRLLSVRYAETDGDTKWGFIVSAKQIGNAVSRNRAKRRLREIVRTQHPKLVRSYSIAVVAKSGSTDASSNELAAELFGLLKRATLVR